jgi:hypothetical protein
MVLKIFAQKLELFVQITANVCTLWILALFFLNKNANFFAEFLEKSLKIVIITSTPGILPRRQ